MANEPHSRHRARVLATAPVLAGLTMVTACTSGHSAKKAPTDPMSDMSMPASSAGASSGPAAPAAPVGANAVTIQGFAFSPATITVKVGTTVTWTNRDQDAHTVTASKGPFKSKTLNTGDTYSYTFTTAGSFDYLCAIHPFMTAKVVVTK
jgi:plastocyanin